MTKPHLNVYIIANSASTFAKNLTLAMNLLSNYEKITAFYQINISGSESIISNVKNNKNELLKTLLGNCKQVSKTALAVRFNLQVIHQCLLLYLLFVIPSCVELNFCVSTQFSDSSN